MSQEKRFGRTVVTPSSAQIIHELKLMALRQSLDAALAQEAATAGLPDGSDAAGLASVNRGAL